MQLHTAATPRLGRISHPMGEDAFPKAKVKMSAGNINKTVLHIGNVVLKNLCSPADTLNLLRESTAFRPTLTYAEMDVGV